SLACSGGPAYRANVAGGNSFPDRGRNRRACLSGPVKAASHKEFPPVRTDPFPRKPLALSKTIPAPALPKPRRTGVMIGIGLKVASVFVMVAMSAIIKGAEGVPVGQLIFYRSAFALIPVFIMLGMRGELISGFRTSRLGAHIFRGCLGGAGMLLIFFGLTRLPLPEATTINYATPLFVVIFSAVFLREKIRLFRWSAVVVGLMGVVIIMWPRLTFLSGDMSTLGPQAEGALAAFVACMVSATAMLTVRDLVRTEGSATIVIYFSLVCTVIGLATLPFGWVALSLEEALILALAGIAGGVGQILLTESYRHAELTT